MVDFLIVLSIRLIEIGLLDRGVGRERDRESDREKGGKEKEKEEKEEKEL